MALMTAININPIVIDQAGTTIVNNEEVNTFQITSVNKDNHILYPGSELLNPPLYLWLLKMRTSDGGCVIWRYATQDERDLDYARISLL